MPSVWFKNLMKYRAMGYTSKEASSMASGKGNRAVSKKVIMIPVFILIVVGVVLAWPLITSYMNDQAGQGNNQYVPPVAPKPDFTLPGPNPVTEPPTTPPVETPIVTPNPIIAPTITSITQVGFWDYTSTMTAIIRIAYSVTDPRVTSTSEINVYISNSNGLTDPVGIAPCKTELADSSIDVTVATSSSDIIPVNVYLTLKIGSDFSLLSPYYSFLIERTAANPQGVPNFVITSTTMGVHLLSWDVVSGAYYNVYRSTTIFTTQGQANLIATITTNTFMDTLTKNGIYYYAVVTVGSGGKESMMSNVVSITVDIPGEPDPAAASYVRIDETSSFHPFSYAVFQGKATSQEYNVKYKTYAQDDGGTLYQFLITEDQLKTWLNVPSLYNSGGEPVVFYGKHLYGSQFMWIIKIGTKWYVAQYGASTLGGVSYALQNIVTRTSGAFILPGGVTDPSPYLISISSGLFNFQLLYALLRLLFFFMM